MSPATIHEIGPPENSIQGTTEEFDVDNIPPTEVTFTKRFPERSSEEKLELLRDFLKRKYAL